MATGNIDCPLSKGNSTYLNSIDCMCANTAALAVPSASTAFGELQKVIDSNLALNILYNPIGASLDNKQTETPNNNIELSMSSDEIQPSGSCINRNDARRPDNKVMVTLNDGNLLTPMIGSVIPEQLSINVDSEEDSDHSWRPSLANALSSDFFLPQPNVNLPKVNHGTLPLRLLSWELSSNNEPSISKADDASHSRPDAQSYVQSQKAELNVLKYEVMNAKRKINENQCAIGNLNWQLKKVLKFPNSQEIEKLTNENSQLRLECQCLCMEVDFYLKGQGDTPLGEVDENFYKGNAAQSNKEVKPRPESRPPDYESEDQEEGNKWECRKCTFANHPAINCCEMCHVPRLRREPPTFHCPSQNTCYCHPQEHAQSS